MGNNIRYSQLLFNVFAFGKSRRIAFVICFSNCQHGGNPNFNILLSYIFQRKNLPKKSSSIGLLYIGNIFNFFLRYFLICQTHSSFVENPNLALIACTMYKSIHNGCKSNIVEVTVVTLFGCFRPDFRITSFYSCTMGIIESELMH